MASSRLTPTFITLDTILQVKPHKDSAEKKNHLLNHARAPHLFCLSCTFNLTEAAALVKSTVAAQGHKPYRVTSIPTSQNSYHRKGTLKATQPNSASVPSACCFHLENAYEIQALALLAIPGENGHFHLRKQTKTKTHTTQQSVSVAAADESHTHDQVGSEGKGPCRLKSGLKDQETRLGAAPRRKRREKEERRRWDPLSSPLTTVRPPQGLLVGRRVPCRRWGVAVGRRPEAGLPRRRRAKEGRAERRRREPAERAHGGAQLAARLHARRVRSRTAGRPLQNASLPVSIASSSGVKSARPAPL